MKENNYLRGIREAKEMSEFLGDYRKTKVHFAKNMAKNYLKQ